MWSWNKIGYDFLVRTFISRSSSFLRRRWRGNTLLRLFWREKFKKRKRERKEEEEKRVEGLEAVLASETLQGLFHSSNLSLLNTRFILPACFSVNKRAGCELVTLVKDIRASSILGACFKLLHRINAMRPPSLPLPRNYTAVEIETRHGSIWIIVLPLSLSLFFPFLFFFFYVAHFPRNCVIFAFEMKEMFVIALQWCRSR